MMSKSEYKIGDTVCFGLIKMKVVDSGETLCRGCALEDLCFEWVDDAFLEHTGKCASFTGECFGQYRTDGKNIIFKRINETENGQR